MGTFSSGYSSALGDILSQVNDAFSGKTSGLNVSTVVSELLQVQNQPKVQLQQEQTTINSKVSALTTISTQLTALQTAVRSLADFQGPLSQMTTGSSDSSLVSAAADETAASGTHTVTVSKLATISSSYSGYIAGGTLAGSQLTVKYGADPNNPVKTDTINIPAGDNTLQSAASSINNGNYGVTASVVTDATGSRLVLVSKTSGANGNLTVSSAATNFTSSAGIDAQLSVDGVPVDSSTNTVTGAIAGVTLSLGGADPNTPVLITVEPDTSQASQAIQNLVTTYNAVMGSINSQFTLDASGKEGVLAGDSMLTSLQSELMGMVSTAVSGVGQYVNLQSMGIEMQNDGTLQINTTNLSSALSSDYADVQKFFESTSPAGWGRQANTAMTNLTDVTLGPVAVDILGLNQSGRDLTNQINDFNVRMSTVQRQLTTQYSTLSALLQEYPLQMQEVAAQLANLPGVNTGSGSQG